MILSVTKHDPLMVKDEAGARNSGDVIFIHGTGSNSVMWKHQIAALTQRGYRCFAFDLRGHGGSAEPKETTNIETHLQDLFETIPAHEIQFPAIFIGHSLGAILSVEIAERNPELVDQVFAAALPGKILPPVVPAFRAFISGPFMMLKDTPLPRRLAWRERTLFEIDRHTLEQIADNFGTLNLVDKEYKVACPVHLSAGRFDPVAPYMYVKRIHKLLPNSTLTVYDWAGHNFMDYNTEHFNEWIISRLESAKQSSRIVRS